MAAARVSLMSLGKGNAGGGGGLIPGSSSELLGHLIVILMTALVCTLIAQVKQTK
jgi:hypothetical protein